jgi:WD40 repeat protein
MRTAILVMLLCVTFVSAPARAQTGSISFSQQVAPILLKQCQSCHGPSKSKGGYRLDTFEKLTTPGRGKKPPITPGKLDKSELYQLLTTADTDDRMPKDGDPLPAKQVNVIRQWIEQGAKYDGDSPRTTLSKLIRPVDYPQAPAVYDKPVAITAMAFDSTGEHLAIGGLHEITIWNAASGKLERRIGNVARQTYALAYTPDGKQLAAASGLAGQSGEVRLFDADSGRMLDVVLSGDDVLLAVAISPDGKMLAAGGADNLLHLVDLQSRKELHKINDHADWITAITFSPDGDQVATASRDRTARLFDVKTGEGHFAYREHDAPVTGVVFLG